MAKATITIVDGEDGVVTVSADFEPELVMAETATNAQQLALDLITDIKNGESFLSQLADGAAKGEAK